MGKDSHIYIMKDGKRLSKNLYDGRNYEWFNNMAGNGNDAEYNHLPVKYGVCEEADDDFKELEDEKGYFDFRYIRVGDFKSWYWDYDPTAKAGYFSEYDIWRIKYKGYIPEDPPTYKTEDANIFYSYEDPYEPSKVIFDYVTDNHISDDAYLCYCFDW